MHFTGGEIIPRRVLCPWRAHLLARKASIDLVAFSRTREPGKRRSGRLSAPVAGTPNNGRAAVRRAPDTPTPACADKAHKVDGDGGARACPRTPHAAGTSTLVALRPPLGV